MPRFESPDAFIEKAARGYEMGDAIFDEKVVHSWESFRPSETDLVGVYEKSVIDHDVDAIRERQAGWDPTPASSKRLEYVLMDGIEKRNWLGDTTDVTPASEYDDIFNGADMIVRFDRGEDNEPLFLVIDATTARFSKLEEKLTRNLSGLQRGRAAEIKYLPPSPEGPTIEQLPLSLPRVVVGTNLESSDQLYQDMVAGLKNHDAMGKIDEHPIQVELIRQMKRQLMLSAEAAASTFVRNSAQDKTMSRYVLGKIDGPLEKIKPLELDELTGSAEWEKFVEAINKRRETMMTANPELAHNIFMHTDLIAELSKIEIEKSSQGIVAKGAEEGTEEYLGIPEKAAVIEHRYHAPIRTRY